MPTPLARWIGSSEADAEATPAVPGRANDAKLQMKAAGIEHASSFRDEWVLL